MLKFLPAPLKGILNSLFIVLHTIFWCTQMYILFFLKKLLPFKMVQRIINPLLLATGNNWIRSNNFMIKMTHDTVWESPNLDHLDLKDWYFVICNHQCWSDILILQRIFLGKVPFIRFFIKKELMWLPILNGAWWAYDFPILKRHSKAAIEKNPKLRGQDLATTQKMCQKYSTMPVTILNFLEGTRFTDTKHKAQQSRFQHLLNPKIGGFGYTVKAMDQQIKKILDVTIAYPDGPKSFWDFLCGRLNRIVINVEEKEIPPMILKSDFLNDPAAREQFKSWVTELWIEKDKKLTQLLSPVNADNTSKNTAHGSVLNAR